MYYFKLRVIELELGDKIPPHISGITVFCVEDLCSYKRGMH